MQRKKERMQCQKIQSERDNKKKTNNKASQESRRTKRKQYIKRYSVSPGEDDPLLVVQKNDKTKPEMIDIKAVFI